MKKISVFIVSIFLTFNNVLIAQEYINGLQINAQVKEYSKQYQENTDKSLKNKAILELPFWDDFSTTEIYPNSNLWQNNYVYINSTLVPEMPSIGVATFDALNEVGAVYAHADYLTPFVADSLTSQPINLNYPADNTIYLSFYYRPSVFEDYFAAGAEPEPGDSLILEFYAPEEDLWYQQWSVAGNNNGIFQFVILQINEDKFLKSGFKFRFKNIASFGSSTYPSLAGNCDFWHIDYVYLNKGRSLADNVFHDIAFTKPLHSLLSGYESAPWSHYKALGTQSINTTIKTEYLNNDNVTRIIDSLNFSVTDMSGNSALQKYFGGTFFPTAFSRQSNELNGHPFIFPYNDNDFCDFEFKARLVTSSFDSAQNNTLKYTQKFRDYYAYDDGSAEAGYGLYGNGTKFGSVAYKFSPYKDDYILGVNMYFTQTFENASQQYFWLNVWNKGADGKPDTTIISYEGKLPEYADELNKFVYFPFEEPVLLSDDIFIGWTQTSEDKLNIGFDFNTVSNQNLYYNKSGEWIQSNIAGSLMIRPVFGKQYTSNITDVKELDMKLYPNPANRFLTVEFTRNFNKRYALLIYDMQGKQVYTDTDFNDSVIDISKLQNGIYFVRLSDNSSVLINKKLIIQKY